MQIVFESCDPEGALCQAARALVCSWQRHGKRGHSAGRSRERPSDHDRPVPQYPS
jgi:hypothetical protein